MKIGIQSWGSPGDNRPLAALARRLDASGHRVKLVVSDVTGADYSRFLAATGVELRQTRTPVPAGVGARNLGRRFLARRNPLGQVSLLMKHLFDPILDEVTHEAFRLCETSHILVGHLTVYPLAVAAERAGLPHVTVATTPLLFPSVTVPAPGFPWTGRAGNLLLWRLSSRLLNHLARKGVNRFRAALGMPGTSRGFRDSMLSSRLNLVGVSPALFPSPPDWNPTQVVCGWLGRPWKHGEGGLGQGLSSFLRKGPAPVCFTMGSMLRLEPSPDRLVKLFADSALSLGLRAVIQCPVRALSSPPAHPDIRLVEGPDHFLLFPRCAGVVHHGGAGTCHTSVLCGKPSVPVAYGIDQGFWGSRLHRLGLATPVIPRRKLGPARLVPALEEMLNSREMEGNAETYGGLIASEDGAGSASRLIEEALSR